MPVVRVVQVAVHQVIDVVAVWHRFMAAAGAVHVLRTVTGAAVLRRAGGGVDGVDLQLMLLDACGPHVVQMAVVQVINVAIVADGRVAATRPVGVVVLRVKGVGRAHGFLSFLWFRPPVAESPAWGSLQFVRVDAGSVNEIGHVPIR